MLLYCKDGIVIEYTGDDAPPRTALVLAGATALPWPKPWDTEGDPPRPRMTGYPPRHPTPHYGAEDLQRAAAWLRWYIETGAIEVGGVRVATSDRSKVLLMGAAEILGDTETTEFPTDDRGGKVSITGAQARLFKAAIAQHVASCFSAWSAVSVRIAAGEITTLEQLYAAPEWPH